MSTGDKKAPRVLKVSGHRLVGGKRKGEVVDISLTAAQVRALIDGGHLRWDAQPTPGDGEKEKE